MNAERSRNEVFTLNKDLMKTGEGQGTLQAE